MDKFKRLNDFQLKMRPAALRVYRSVFGECSVEDLRSEDTGSNEPHVLDRLFGIDSMLVFPSGVWVSLQEKYRHHAFLRYGDFTQEFKNAAGTVHENPGEWFHLGAQLYFYGWTNERETEFQRWVILDIAKYKVLVELSGGLSTIGSLRQNNEHGRASFYAIPIEHLRDAIMFSSS